MKVELHLHTSRYSACSTAGPGELLTALVQAGYDAVYITEHDAVWRAYEIADLQDDFPQIRIFGGVELMIGGSITQHLIILGTTDPQYVSIRNDVQQVLAKARAEGHLAILAHPFRWEGSGLILKPGSLPDAIEYHTCNHDPICAERSLKASLELELPLVNAGDVHALDFVNRFWIQTRKPIKQADDIRRIVLDGEYENRFGNPTGG